MTANLTNQTEISNLNDFGLFDQTGYKLVLVLIHALTLLILFTSAKMLYDRVEISHPLFGAIFQEIILLCACETLTYVLLLFMMVHRIDKWVMVYMAISSIAGQFHQTTWCAITYLRYNSCKQCP